MGIRTYIGFCFDRPKSFCFGLTVTGFSLLFLFMMVRFIPLSGLIPNQPEYEDLSAQGGQGKARIEELDTVRNTSHNGVHPIRIVYSYSDAEAARIKDTVETMAPVRLELGSEVAVRFTERDSALEGFPPFFFPFFVFLLIPGVFAMFGFPFLVFSLVGARRKIRLYRTGALAEGKLLSLTPMYMGFLPFASTRFIAAYSYHPDGAEAYQTTSILSDLAFINEKRSGDAIEILFDRRNPKYSCVKERLS